MSEGHAGWTVSDTVGLSAVINCAARAVESDRPDHLINDPLAAHFVHAVRIRPTLPTRVDELERSGAAGAMVASRFGGIRARVMDDFLLAANAAGIDQAVIFSPGFDTRAYRLDWPSEMDFYEVEQPGLLSLKDTVLHEAGAEPRCARHTAGVDPRQDEWESSLRSAGFDPTRPAAWVAEGILLYLSAQGEADLFTAIHKLSAPGSRLAMQYMPADLIHWFAAHTALTDTTELLGVDIGSVNWNTEPRQAAPARLEAAGWGVRLDSVMDRGLALGVSLHEEFSAVGSDAGIEFPVSDEPDGFLFGTLPR
ncbi:SAM-dependent methyltransferase [Streptomyces sp. SID5643]|uniref:SAM-dependent methyltransferase n=1 Tax=Streptomyces sp. SID5643 TaxID=2690307 RepID=UPI00136A1A6C|nr:SAM-dependent methyltransferase [Streptomyces sp. SID5643]MZF85337.1 SAM-dependent methyltransferase [Streptomyces sp. SID5643]